MSAIDLARQVVANYEHRQRFDKLSFYSPFLNWERDGKFYPNVYPWQVEFHEEGATNAHRALFAANRVGKTRSGAAEIAIHLTGRYPDWWKGFRFNKPIEWWSGSISNELQKDGMQKALLGSDLGENFGTGMLPKASIIGKPTKRQCGISDVADTVKVRHASGGVSTLRHKTYEQGARMWQSGAPDGISLDEQPDEHAANEKMIFSEVVTRLVDTNGILLATLTPLLGETDLTRHFMNPPAKRIWWRGASWGDAPHLTEEAKKLAMASYPEHERLTRTTGIPMMGEGAVFPVGDEEISCAPFEIPKHFFRINGIDFGYDHPFGLSCVAYDADKDIVYVTDCYRKKGETTVLHAAAIKKRGEKIPVAWPHDGMNAKDTGAARAIPLWHMYLAEGVNMLPFSARYKDEKGGDDKGGSQAVEPIVMEVLERMQTGRFKVFSHLSEWFEEKRSYHRKDGKIVPIRDDLLKATFYAVMMLRYAAQTTLPRVARRISQPIVRNW